MTVELWSAVAERSADTALDSSRGGRCEPNNFSLITGYQGAEGRVEETSGTTSPDARPEGIR